MKSYLSLIPISAKVHKRQHRMTQLCIIVAVFLVTAVFSMADMGIRMEATRLIDKHGGQALKSISTGGMAQTLYVTAAVLFIFILIAGVLMISSSMNSSIAQRTKFFGMMRCIGMSKEQVIRFVRLEALNWCKTAVPIGTLLGVIVTWLLCGVLRFVVREEFAQMPLFGVSIIGICSGIVMGIVTVLIAASAPAKRAAKVSPMAAVASSEGEIKNVGHGINTRFLKIETALGIQHAVNRKKNLLLMTSSFALSIILFLMFSVLIDFVGYIMPQSSNISDISIYTENGTNTINRALKDEISQMPGVKHIYGRKNALGIDAKVNGAPESIDLIAYDSYDLECLKKDKQLRKGSDLSKVYGESQYVLSIWDKAMPLEIGQNIQVGNQTVELAGLLKYDPFSEDGNSNGKITLISSGETFEKLTGIEQYSLLMIQMTRDATDENVEAIRQIVGETYRFQDKRDQRTTSTYIAFSVFVYGFLMIITLVSVLNIINSISMSVSARIKQYGIIRAIGMNEKQIIKMIMAEAFTYAGCGLIVGCVGGLWISKMIYANLITTHFSYAVWTFPVRQVIIILVCIIISVVAAVYTPSKRIMKMAITDTINEL